MRGSAERGFSFLEVLIAMSVMLIGSVAVLALFAVGVNDLVQRRVDAKLAKVEPEIRMLVQDAVDKTAPGADPENIPRGDTEPPVPMSEPGYAVRIRFDRSAWGGSSWFAKAVLYYQDKPIRLLPPIAVTRSTIDPAGLNR